MKYISFIFFFCFCLTSAFSQSDSSKVEISLNTHFEGNSNSIPNSMLSTLLWGGNMSESFLGGIRANLYEKQNRFGFEFKNQVAVKWKGKKVDWQVGAKYRELLGFSYPIGLFGLAFLGNQGYEGKSVDLSNTKFQYLQYSGLSFGFLKSLGQGKSGILYSGISFLYGFNNQKLATKNAHFYTAPDAAYIQTDGDLNLQYSGQKPGLGLGLDFNYTFERNRDKLYFSVEDLGFMNWQKITQFEGNSSTTYKGAGIANIANYTGDSLFSNFTTRGFANRFGVTETQKSVTILLPFALTARYQHQFNEKWKSILQVYYTYMPAYIPRSSAKMERSFANNWNVNAGLAYGGFGRENVLIGCNKSWSNKWSFSVDGYFLGMAILPKSSYGIGMNFGIKRGF